MRVPDWRDIIIKIGKVSQLKDYQIAQRLGVAASTLNNTKQGCNEPRWIFGERLIALAKFYEVEVVYK